MYRSTITVLTAAILILVGAASASAQVHMIHRGGPTFGASTFGPATTVVRPPAVVRTSPIPVVRGPVTPFVRPGLPIIPPVGIGAVVRPHPHPRPVIVSPVIVSPGFYSPFYPSFVGGPAYYPGGPAYYPYPATPYPDTVYAPPSPVQNPGPSQAETDLAYQVGKLTQEVEQLRQQQQQNNVNSYTLPPAQSQTSQDRSGVPIVLVFRDGHRMEIQNYAIVGETLWVLDQNSSTRILLSQLDLDATQLENRARGGRFLVPGK